MIWTPHATVAVIVENNAEFLLVEERSNGQTVYNQPAGHIEKDESILDAAIRETVEETGWAVELKAFIGLYTYKAPSNNVTYYRFCFAASPIKKVSDTLDKDIISEHWLSYSDIVNIEDKLRSPLVLKCIDDYRRNVRLPLDTIYEHPIKQT